MTDYKLNLRIENEILRILVINGYNLCFAVDVNGSFNVAAQVVTSINLAPNIQITWKTNYSEAATKQIFSPGTVIESPAAPALPISLKEEYVIDSWNEPPTVNQSQDVPPNSFGLATGNVEASAVLYLEIYEESAPVYFSPEQAQRKSTMIFEAGSKKVAVWFQSNIQTSTMLDASATADAHILDFTTEKNRTTAYTNNGKWIDRALE